MNAKNKTLEKLIAFRRNSIAKSRRNSIRRVKKAINVADRQQARLEILEILRGGYYEQAI